MGCGLATRTLQYLGGRSVNEQFSFPPDSGVACHHDCKLFIVMLSILALSSNCENCDNSDCGSINSSELDASLAKLLHSFAEF